MPASLRWVVRILIVSIGIVLAACGAETSPIIVTEIPTSTPSAQPPPSATFTVAPTVEVAVALGNTATAFSTVDRRRDLTRTAGPSPTSPLGPTYTPAPATLTATALPTLAGLEIEYFANETTGALTPGSNVTLFWRVLGAERVSIFRLDAEGEQIQEWRVDGEGRITVGTEVTDVVEAKFVLVATTGDAVANSEISVLLSATCAQLWFFSPAPAGCPSDSGVPTVQVEQRFENGFMIWLGSTREIVIVYNDDQTPRWLRVPDQYTEDQPASDETIQPPADRFQPIRGFGLVWRNNPRTRERLGWAIEPELSYDGIVQTVGLTDTDRLIYMRTRDGGILELSANGSAWQILPFQPALPTPTPTTPPQ